MEVSYHSTWTSQQPGPIKKHCRFHGLCWWQRKCQNIITDLKSGETLCWWRRKEPWLMNTYSSINECRMVHIICSMLHDEGKCAGIKLPMINAKHSVSFDCLRWKRTRVKQLITVNRRMVLKQLQCDCRVYTYVFISLMTYKPPTIKSNAVNAHWVGLYVASNVLALNYNSQIFHLNAEWPFIVCCVSAITASNKRLDDSLLQKSPSPTTVSSKCVNVIELAQDNGGQAWTVPIITRYSDVCMDKADRLQLEETDLVFYISEDFFFFLLWIRERKGGNKSSLWCSSLCLKMSR